MFVPCVPVVGGVLVGGAAVAPASSAAGSTLGRSENLSHDL